MIITSGFKELCYPPTVEGSAFSFASSILGFNLLQSGHFTKVLSFNLMVDFPGSASNIFLIVLIISFLIVNFVLFVAKLFYSRHKGTKALRKNNKIKPFVPARHRLRLRRGGRVFVSWWQIFLGSPINPDFRHTAQADNSASLQPACPG